MPNRPFVLSQWRDPVGVNTSLLASLYTIDPVDAINAELVPPFARGNNPSTDDVLDRLILPQAGDRPPLIITFPGPIPVPEIPSVPNDDMSALA